MRVDAAQVYMVVVKGGGTVYEISSGKVIPSWDDVPGWFKQAASDSQREIPSCSSIKEEAQQCMQAKGFWDPECVKLTDAFHLCSSKVLRTELPADEAAQIALSRNAK